MMNPPAIEIRMLPVVSLNPLPSVPDACSRRRSSPGVLFLRSAKEPISQQSIDAKDFPHGKLIPGIEGRERALSEKLQVAFESLLETTGFWENGNIHLAGG